MRFWLAVAGCNSNKSGIATSSSCSAAQRRRGHFAARAQQSGRLRRIGVLMTYAADDPAGQAHLLAFAQELAQLGWIDGRNVRIDVRWGAVDPERFRSYAAELVALAPDVIAATGSAAAGSFLERESRITGSAHVP